MDKSVREVNIPFGSITSPNGDNQLSRQKYFAFAERVQRAAELAGLNAARLAARLDLTPGTMSRYWNGERLPPSDTLIELCEIIGVSPEWLIKGKTSAVSGMLRGADDADWIEIHEFDLRDLSDGGKGTPIGTTFFRRDWLYLTLGESSGLWITKTLVPDIARGIPVGAAIVCKDFPIGDTPIEGQHYVFRAGGGVMIGRFSYRSGGILQVGDRLGETIITPADLEREDHRHYIVARVLGALARPFV